LVNWLAEVETTSKVQPLAELFGPRNMTLATFPLVGWERIAREAVTNACVALTATERLKPSCHISQRPPTKANGSDSMTIRVSVSALKLR